MLQQICLYAFIYADTMSFVGCETSRVHTEKSVMNAFVTLLSHTCYHFNTFNTHLKTSSTQNAEINSTLSLARGSHLLSLAALLSEIIISLWLISVYLLPVQSWLINNCRGYLSACIEFIAMCEFHVEELLFDLWELHLHVWHINKMVQSIQKLTKTKQVNYNRQP